MTRNASSTEIIVSSHVHRCCVLLLLNGRLGCWQLDEDSVNIVLQCLEKLSSIGLQSRILKVRAHLQTMGSKQRGDVVLTPLIVPLLLLEHLHDLPFVLILALHVLLDQQLGQRVCGRNWGVP